MKHIKPGRTNVVRIIGSIIAAVVIASSVPCQAADGYGRNATGGTGGADVTATTLAQFKQYAESTTTYTITVSGTINIGSGVSVKVKSNKTIKGANTSSKIIGCLDLGGSSNIIIQNLDISNPGGDGITVWGSKTVYITKCTIHD